MKKKTLAILLCLCLCMGMLTMAAFAEGAGYGLEIGNVAITPENVGDITGAINAAAGETIAEGSAAFDPNTNTLTLTDFVLCSGEADEAQVNICIDSDIALNIVLFGDNQLGETVLDEDDYLMYTSNIGIAGDTDITISGAGSLTTYGLYCGISSTDGNITVSEDFTGTLSIFNCDDDDVYGSISLDDGSVTLAGGTVNLCSEWGCCINIAKSGDITVTGGEVNLAGYESGIYTNCGDITVSGGEVYAYDEEYDWAVENGLWTEEGDIVISGGEVDITAFYVGFGAMSGNITISGGDVSLWVIFEESSVGIGAGVGNIEISGGNVQVRTECDQAVIVGLGNIEISGGTLDLSSGQDCAIYAEEGDITVSGGELLLEAEGLGILTVAGDIEISGGSINAPYDWDNDKAPLYGGICATEGDITVSGGSVDIAADFVSIYTAEGSIEISGGDFSARVINGYGIIDEKGSVTISGGKTDISSEGNAILACEGNVEISNGYVNLNVSYMTEDELVNYDESYNNCVEVLNGDLLISGGTVIIDGGSRDVVHVESGDVTVSGGEGYIATGDYGLLCSDGSITFTGGYYKIDVSTQAVSASEGVTLDGVSMTDTYSGEEVEAPYTDANWVTIGEPYDTYPVWVGDTQVSENNKNDVLYDGTVSYTPATDTACAVLTLNNADLTGRYCDYRNSVISGIYAEEDLTIRLVGANSVIPEEILVPLSADPVYYNTFGIYADRELNFTGSGTLTVQSMDAATYYMSFGIFASGGISMDSGTVTAIAGNCFAGDDDDPNSCGICATDDITVSGGTLTGIGGEGACCCYGIHCFEGDITVNGGTLTGIAADAETSIGIFDYGSILISGGTVTGTAGEAEDSCFGITASGDITVSGGTVNASAQDGDVFCIGIYAGEVLSFTGGTTTASCGENGDCAACGEEGIEITDLIVKADVNNDGAAAAEVDIDTFIENFDGYKYVQIAPKPAPVPVPVIIEEKEFPFTDVPETRWSRGDVEYCYDKGYMIGVSDTLFDPTGYVTRGMVMTMLARLDGVDTEGCQPWYQAGLDWAVENGISDGTNPTEEITREQMMAMLYRYAQKQGMGFTGAWMFLLDFSDIQEISSWADEAAHWCVMKGVIKGHTDGTLDPKGIATREQLAAVFHRFCGVLGK